MHNVSKQIILAGRGRDIERVRLGGFLRLQVAKKKIYDAVTKNDSGAIADGLYLYLKELFPDLQRAVYNKLDWLEVLTIFSSGEQLNVIPNQDDFAMLVHSVDSNPEPWHYDERFYYSMIHTLAISYHWSREEIENLWPEEGIAFLQEIMAQEYREWAFQHALSPVSYPYDKASKTQKYTPFAKPAWMLIGTGKMATRGKNHNVPKEMLPVGEVMRSPHRKDDYDSPAG